MTGKRIYFGDVFIHLIILISERRGGWLSSVWRIRAWCIAWWHSGREDSDTEEESPSEQGQGCITPVSLDTPCRVRYRGALRST
ncbi:hypothetical protein NQ318_013226 [Aromia moschata]|uniref:Secreted protein n=1 Tax=Aromia moschata TaxID=1265417 RepID=A0AAV8YAR4_9CUCU|nr:hypothetical protein NQ318_013226 [Aromia moschata]